MMTLRNHFAALCFMALLGGTAVGCGSSPSVPTGAAGIGGGAAGTTGGGAGAGAGGDAAGIGGSAAASTGDTRTPQQVHDDFINAPTSGGLSVTRTPPATVYPACQ